MTRSVTSRQCTPHRHSTPIAAPESPLPSSASVGCTDFSEVDMLGVRYTSGNFGSGASLVLPNWRHNRPRTHLVVVRGDAPHGVPSKYVLKRHLVRVEDLWFMV